MRMFRVPGLKPGILVRAALAAAALLLLAAPVPAAGDDATVTMETLLDRIQIEDLLVRYYADLSAGEGHDMAQFYTEDAVLDVNGMIAKGRAAIEKMYGGLGEGGSDQTGNRVHMLLTNPVIIVKGDTARAWVIWTGIINENVRLRPRFMEQGREYDELVKIGGRWFIKKRTISADSGMPAIWDETYKPREHPIE
ncbi:MAG: nuclear transport factor 2 family protein [Acidobacteria bacterium]|nr:nuclear transport factor 2 family protein [Acidobacteriota bacterium]